MQVNVIRDEVENPDLFFTPQINDIYIPPIPSNVYRFVQQVWNSFVTKTVSLKFSDGEYCFEYAAFEAIEKNSLKIVSTIAQSQLRELSSDSNNKGEANNTPFVRDTEPTGLGNKENLSIKMIREAILAVSAHKKPDVKFYNISEVEELIPGTIRSLISSTMNYAAGICLFVKGEPIGILWGIRRNVLEQTQLKELTWQMHSLLDGIENIINQELERGGDAFYTRQIIEKLDCTSQIYRIFYTKLEQQALPVKSKIAHSYTYEKSYRLDTSYIIPTSDGFNVSLKQYLPEEKNDTDTILLMIPGFFCNRSLMDRLAMEMSLVYGFQVFSADMRGRSKFTLPQNRNIGSGWTIDDYIWRDFPATLSWLHSHFPDKKIVIFGHSMGGMVPKFYSSCHKKMKQLDRYGFLPDPERHLAGIVSITSPSYIDLETGIKLIEYIIAFGRTLGSNDFANTIIKILSMGIMSPFATIDLNRLFSVLNSVSNSARALSFDISTRIPTLKDFIGYEQITTPEWYFFTENVFCEEAVKVVIQFARSLLNRNATFSSYDGEFDYANEQAGLTIPLFSIIGTKDKIAPPETIEYGISVIGSENVRKSHYEQGHMGIVIHPETVKSIGNETNEWIHDILS